MQAARAIAWAGLAAIIALGLALLRARWMAPLGDLTWPLCAARALMAGLEPYAACPTGIFPPNMLPTALLMLPLAPLDQLAGPVAWALMTGILVWAALSSGRPWVLWVLMSAPYWLCFWWVQWSPLLLAIALAPALYPLLWCKPHVGLPVALLRWRWPGVLACLVILGLSLMLLPSWPALFLAGASSTYDGGSQLLNLPFGPMLLLCLLRWREERARWLLIYAVVPVRGLYDLCGLWIICRDQREAQLLAALSWLAVLDAADTSIFLLTVSLMLIWDAQIVPTESRHSSSA